MVNRELIMPTIMVIIAFMVEEMMGWFRFKIFIGLLVMFYLIVMFLFDGIQGDLWKPSPGPALKKIVWNISCLFTYKSKTNVFTPILYCNRHEKSTNTPLNVNKRKLVWQHELTQFPLITHTHIYHYFEIQSNDNHHQN